MSRARSSRLAPATGRVPATAPSRSTTTSSQTSSTSPSLWLMKTTERPSSRSRQRMPSKAATSGGLRLEVGSSRTSSSAPRRIALRISTRCWSPRGRSPTRASGSRSSPYSALAAFTREATTAGASQRPSSRQPSITFSVTVIAGTSMKCWCTMPMPAAMASRGERTWSGRPLNAMAPASAATIPNRMFISVVLPEPFSPSSPTMRAAGTVRSTERLARTAP